MLTANYLKRQNKEIIPFTIACKRIKSLAISLTKEVKYLSPENYKTLIGRTGENENQGLSISGLYHHHPD